MYIKSILLSFFLLMLHELVSAQYYNQEDRFLKANNIWVFGFGAGLDFSTGTAVPIRTAIRSVESCASVSDSTGQLLFYLGSDSTIWNRHHVPMFNGTGLYPFHQLDNGSSSAQGVVIVPVIDTPWKYYVFINTQIQGYWDLVASPYLTYSVVDMTLDNGLGGIEPGRKNIPLYNYGLNEAMIAVPGDNCDVWLIALSSHYPYQPFNTNLPETQCFLAWHITRNGIDSNYIMSRSNIVNDNITPSFSMSVSPDRTRIALGISNGALLSKFDPSTGVISDGIILRNRVGRLLSATVYSSCFSPDNTKLYVDAGTISQYNISIHDSTTITSTEYVIYVPNSGALKLYRDTVYVAASSSNVVHRINNPNLDGVQCGFDFAAIHLLPGTFSGFGLPTDVVSPKVDYISSVFYDTICHSSTKELSAASGFSFYEWDDGTIGMSREINAPGTYWVRYQESACMKYTDTFIVEVVDASFSLGEDRQLFFCDHPDSYLRLESYILDADYRWQDGSILNYYDVRAPGNYWLEVNLYGCFFSDTVNITGVEELDLYDTSICKGDAIHLTFHTPSVPLGTILQWSTGSSESSISVTDTGLYWVNLINPPCVLSDSAYIQSEYCECFAHVPNIFSPNGDGVNDYFLPVIEHGCPVSGYVLNLYNRYGERLYQSFDAYTGWDGQHHGRPSDVGVYFYEIYFEGGTRKRKFYFKGDVSLIR
jgi:gliding motility-associated-like protein